MRREDLLYSIGSIDEKYISEADRPYFGLMPRIMKYGSIAASLILVMTVSFFLIFHVMMGVNGGDGMDDGYAGGSDYGDGFDGSTGNSSGGSGSTTGSPESDVLYAEFGTLSLLDISSNKITLSLNIVEDASKIDVRLTLSKDGNDFVLTTEENYEGTEVSLGLPKITVDGIDCDELPTEAGSYTVVIDYTEASLAGYALTLITLPPFGSF